MTIRPTSSVFYLASDPSLLLSRRGWRARLSLVPSPYLHAREMVWCTKFKYLALLPQMRNVQSNCRMITSSHRNEIATYRVRESIVPCVEAGHQNGNPITTSIILIGLTWCVMCLSCDMLASVWSKYLNLVHQTVSRVKIRAGYETMRD